MTALCFCSMAETARLAWRTPLAVFSACGFRRIYQTRSSFGSPRRAPCSFGSAQGKYWWLDGEGKVLSEAMGHGELPVLHDRTGLAITVGSTIAGVPWGFVEQAIAALPAVSDFEYTLEDGLIVFVTTDRWPVYLGTGGNPAYKVSVLRELTAVLTTEGAQVVYIDIKNERRPAVQYAAG